MTATPVWIGDFVTVDDDEEVVIVSSLVAAEHGEPLAGLRRAGARDGCRFVRISRLTPRSPASRTAE